MSHEQQLKRLHRRFASLGSVHAPGSRRAVRSFERVSARSAAKAKGVTKATIAAEFNVGLKEKYEREIMAKRAKGLWK